MKKITQYIVTLTIVTILTTSCVEALSVKGPDPYFAKLSFIESTIPKEILINEVFDSNQYYYQIKNNTDKPLYFFIKSSYSKEDVSKNLQKINKSLPTCSSEVESKTEIGCLNLMDGSNLSSHNRITPFDGRLIFDNEEEALRTKLNRVSYPNKPKPIPVSIYGIYESKLIHIRATINYEINKDYFKKPAQEKFIYKIIKWLQILF